MSRTFNLLAGLLLPLNSLVSSQQDVASSCTLTCENGGRCEWASNDNDELSLIVQSGKMVQQCICPDGYGGSACELQLRQCNLSTRKCYNGKKCMRSPDTSELSCDCAEADKVSMFAGMMCRNPYTEYCANEFDPNDRTSYCTNGGKCKNSLIGAQIAPGNTSVNHAFRHLGCVCPTEFYGPHCEILNYDRTREYPEENFESGDGSGQNRGNDADSEGGTGTNTAEGQPTSKAGDDPSIIKDNLLFIGIGVSFGISLCFLCCVVLYARRRSNKRFHHTGADSSFPAPDPPSHNKKKKNESRRRDSTMESLVISPAVSRDSSRLSHSRSRNDSLSPGADGQGTLERPYICDDDDDDDDDADDGDHLGRRHADGLYRDHRHQHDSYDPNYHSDDDDDEILYPSDSTYRSSGSAWQRHPSRSSWEHQRLEPEATRRRDGRYDNDLYIPTIS